MTEATPAGATRGSGSSNLAVRRALKWYLLWSVVALAAVSLGVVLVSGVIVRNEALRDSQRTARAVADSIVAPLADQDFHDRDPAAMAAMQEAMATRSRDGSLLHVKVWEDAGNHVGRILYADENPLIGKTYEMEEDEYSLFGTTGTFTSISDLRKPENQFDRSAGELVEVYAGVKDVTGELLLFEAYIPTDRLVADSQALTMELLPLTLGALLALSLTTLPLAVSLARRVDRSQQERARLLSNAVESSDLERRRIAQDLHDGVVQDLAGVGYALTSLSRRLPDDAASREPIDEAAAIVRRDVAALRTLMTDIYPPDLDHRGLAEAVRDLLAQDFLGTAQVTYEVDEPLTPSATTARLVFRVVREALRNVAKHAAAAHVSVRLSQLAGDIRFEVVDDGLGFDSGRDQPEGHLGLRLVKETVADAGGSLEIVSEPGHGTRVAGSLPL